MWDGEMVEECSTDGKDEKCILVLFTKPEWKRPLDLHIDWSMI
jgi:hypothetical protein